MCLAAADRAGTAFAQPSLAGALAVWVAVVFPGRRDGDLEPLGDVLPRKLLGAQACDAGRGLVASASEGGVCEATRHGEPIYSWEAWSISELGRQPL